VASAASVSLTIRTRYRRYHVRLPGFKGAIPNINAYAFLSSAGSLAILHKILLGHREICSHYRRSIECECRPGSKCNLVSAIFVGRLATLHLRHFSTVFGGPAGREWVLHSKLHVPAFLATHSAAVVRSFSPILLFSPHFTVGAAHHLAKLPDVRFVPIADIRLQLATITRQHSAKQLLAWRRDSAPPPSRAHRQIGQRTTMAGHIRKLHYPQKQTSRRANAMSAF
jgi:hypothetical protein